MKPEKSDKSENESETGKRRKNRRVLQSEESN